MAQATTRNKIMTKDFTACRIRQLLNRAANGKGYPPNPALIQAMTVDSDYASHVSPPYKSHPESLQRDSHCA